MPPERIFLSFSFDLCINVLSLHMKSSQHYLYCIFQAPERILDRPICHPQRFESFLLREINEILPGLEETGSRLTKRPRISRRQKCSFESDPWTVYVKCLKSSVCEDRMPKQAPGYAVHHLTTRTLENSWRCCADGFEDVTFIYMQRFQLSVLRDGRSMD